MTLTKLAAASCVEQMKALRCRLRLRAHERLTEVFKAADHVPFDDDARIIFFSDCHRGDNSRSDAFARNEGLFLQALGHYYRHGFTYVEVGDGDELWQNRRFGAVREAHGRTFDLLHRFNRERRLHLLLGNHDIQGNSRHRMEKDGIPVHESLILQHTTSDQRIFVVHGHQADFKSDYLYRLARTATRHVWRHLQNLGLGDGPSKENEGHNRGKIRRQISEWVAEHAQTVVCGHTHTPAFPREGEPPYFNTGSCVYDDYITGLEIQNGKIALIKWSQVGMQVERTLLTAPRSLRLVA